jgi:hypothetical protein
MHSEIFRVSIIQFLHAFRNISSFDQFRPDLDYARDAFRNNLNFDQFRPDLDYARARERDFSMHSEIFRVSTNFDQIWITRAMHSGFSPAALPGSLTGRPCPPALQKSLQSMLYCILLLGRQFSSSFSRN